MSTKDTSVKVEKIVITIGEETLELTPAQAKELHEQLYSMFGPVTIYTPFPVSDNPLTPPYELTCVGTSTTMLHNASSKDFH